MERELGRGGGNVKKSVIGTSIAANTNAKSLVTHLRKRLRFVRSRHPSLQHAPVRKHPSPSNALPAPTPFPLVLSHVARLTPSVDIHAPRSATLAFAPPVPYLLPSSVGVTVGIILATELAILATVDHARRFVESRGKNVGILALSPVMRLLPVHQSMRYLVLRSSPRLADALGISESGRSSSQNQITWNPDLIAFAKTPANQAFVKNMEKALADFVAGDKKAHVLPHMPEARRKIVAEVAEVYRITTQLIDEEPRRSVQLIRRIDSRVPTPSLSQVSAPAPSRLGSLGDLRKPATVIKPASPGGSSASIAPAWRSGTPPSHITPNVTSGSPASNSGPPTSGNLPPGSGVTPWARPNVASAVRAPTPSPASRAVSAPLESGHVGETRGDVPANWEDE
ncbi:unnamed protein product [Rhizoctonia solani]|uniref:R3H domain-containing protein n=1 Tax=Rhizoctonia solani TaxID=456999 RepID=A0A8H2XVI1_9AGAM|nr:unnamed protein product [Rhizoctonia solani]